MPCVSYAVNDDYGSSGTNLEFRASASTGDIICSNITIVDDSLFEFDEVFLVTMATSNPSQLDPDMTQIEVVIIDNDSKCLL